MEMLCAVLITWHRPLILRRESGYINQNPLLSIIFRSACALMWRVKSENLPGGRYLTLINYSIKKESGCQDTEVEVKIGHIERYPLAKENNVSYFSFLQFLKKKHRELAFRLPETYISVYKINMQRNSSFPHILSCSLPLYCTVYSRPTQRLYIASVDSAVYTRESVTSMFP